MGNREGPSEKTMKGFFQKQDGPARSMPLSKRARAAVEMRSSAAVRTFPEEMPPVLRPGLLDCTFDDIKANLDTGEFVKLQGQ